MQRVTIALGLIGAAMFLVVPAAGADTSVMYASSNPGSLGSTEPAQLITLDLSTGTGTLVGQLPSIPTPIPFLRVEGSTEIECQPIATEARTALCYSQGRDGTFRIVRIDLTTGSAVGGSVETHGSFTGLEWVGDRLYGTVITTGGGSAPSQLRVLQPGTGSSVLVGATGVGPIAGLAYDGTTMYGIAGGSGPAHLYTLDLATGAATVVGSTGIQAGSLQFGPDGLLYAGGTGPSAGNLFRIDPATGAANLVGSTGFDSITGLTLVTFRAAPEPTPPPAPAPAVVVTPRFAG